MNVIGPMLMLAAGIGAFLLASGGSVSVGGGILLSLGLGTALVSGLRILPSTSGKSLALPKGLGAWSILGLVAVALAAAIGAGTTRAVAAQKEGEAARQRQELEMLAKKALTVPDQCIAMLAGYSGGNPAPIAARLEELGRPFAPLAGTAAGARPDVRAALDSIPETKRELAKRADAWAQTEAARVLALPAQGLESLRALVTARDVLSPLDSAVAQGATQQVIDRLLSSTAKLPTLGQPEVVLDGKLGAALQLRDTKSLRRIVGLPNANVHAVLAGPKCVALYASEVAPGESLAPGVVSQMVEWALGAGVKAPALRAPGSRGSQQATLTVGGTPLHATWFDGRLVEVWVGEFRP